MLRSNIHTFVNPRFKKLGFLEIIDIVLQERKKNYKRNTSEKQK